MDYRSFACLKAAQKNVDLTSACALTKMTPVQFSQTVTSLNREFGVELITKHDQYISLTEYGEVLLPRAINAFQLLRNAEQRILDQSNIANSTIHLNVTTPFHNISKLLEEFKRYHPKLNVICSTPDELTLLGTHDLELRASEKLLEDSANRINLAQESYLILVGKDHRLSSQKYVSISDLYNEDTIFSSNETDLIKLAQELFYEAGSKPKVRAILQSAREVMSLVESGIGYCFCGSITWLAYCDFDVVPLRIKDLHRNRNLFLSWPADAYLSQGSWDLANFLIRTFTDSLN